MFGMKTESRTVVDEALDRSRAVSAHADRLNLALDKYLQSPDPFKALAVDVFERIQEDRIHLGPPR